MWESEHVTQGCGHVILSLLLRPNHTESDVNLTLCNARDAKQESKQKRTYYKAAETRRNWMPEKY